MERLTKKSETGNAYYPKCFEEPCLGSGFCRDDSCGLVYEACKKLSDYEDLEEQGLLLKLPCKVGDSASTIVEKQTPKKPNNIKIITNFPGKYYTTQGDCPMCGEEGLYKLQNYCHKCGQKLDWGDD